MMQQNLAELIGAKDRRNVSDQLYHSIRGLIMSSVLEEGYTFPNETELCDQLQVGRTTLREAYKALELSGFVTRTKRGTFVNSKSVIMNATPLKTIFEEANTQDFNQFRLMIEMKSSYFAALHAGLEDIQKLEENLSQSRAARNANDFEMLMKLDYTFHTSIANLSKNSLMISTVSVMAAAWENNIRQNFAAAMQDDQRIFDTMIAQHEAILNAIRSRDCAGAEKAMETHIQTVSARKCI